MKKIKAKLLSDIFLLETELTNYVMRYGMNSNEYYKAKSEINPKLVQLREELSLLEKKEEKNKWII